MRKFFLTMMLVLLALSPAAATEKKTIQVALLLDTSNSMDGLINQAKSQLWKIVNELSQARYDGEEPELYISLFEYGNSNLSVKQGYIRMLSPFTQELDEISGQLFGLQTKGGSEYCGQVIDVAVKQLAWSVNEKDLKMIFIAGNEPFTQGSTHYIEAVTGAKAKNIVVNTIFCGHYQLGIKGQWADGAQRGGGDYLNIDQDEKIIAIPTPYDDQLLLLNKQLNSTYKGYGAKGREKRAYQATQDTNAYTSGKTSAVSRVISKSKKAYRNTSWDLVDAAEADKDFVAKVKKEDLPEEYQSLSSDELQEKISVLREKRSTIQQEIGALEQKRRVFISKELAQQGDTGSSLDKAMVTTIRKQAKEKNYSFGPAMQSVQETP